MQMQKNFIEELENLGKKNIDDNTAKIDNLMKEVEFYIRENSGLEEDVFKYTKEQQIVNQFWKKQLRTENGNNFL